MENKGKAPTYRLDVRWIKVSLRTHDMTVARLARIIGKEPGSLYEILKRNKPTVKTAGLIAWGLGQPIRDIIERVEVEDE